MYYGRKIIRSAGSFSFFFSDQNCRLYSKIIDSSRVRTTVFSSSRSGIRALVVPNTFTIYPWHFLLPEIGETLKDSPTKIFGTVRQKIFDGKSWYSSPPLSSINFRYRKISETQHGRVPLWSFRYCETKEIDRKSWYPTPLLSLTFFDTRDFLKHREVPLRNFSALWGKQFFNGKLIYPFA